MANRVALILAVLGVIVAWWFSTIDESTSACRPQPIVLQGIFAQEITVDPCRVFSDSYPQARTRFRQAAVAAGGALSVLTVEGNYTIDVTVLKGSLPGLTVHTSGVHGVEGYAGSAIQIAFLEALQSIEQDLPTVILVHAFNPVGMAHYRRTNENNVDLNRNALTAEQWQTYATNHYNRKSYSKFDKYLFNPPQAPTTWSAHGTFWVRALIGIQKHGLPTLKAAMIGGQYHKPSGIFYGGTKVERSTQLVEGFMHDFLLNHPALAVQAVTWLDVHTGLGKSGHDTIMTAPTSTVWPGKDPATECATWFPSSNSPFQAANTNAASVVQGYEKVKGVTTDYYEQQLFTAEQQVSRP